MSEEEKEAIENTKKKIEATQKGLEEGRYYGERFNLEQDIKREQVLLNYIDKLQKIIKKQSYTNKKLRNKIKTVRKERNKLQKENKKIDKAADKMYEYISYYGWEDFESNTGCNREEMVDYFYKE